MPTYSFSFARKAAFVFFMLLCSYRSFAQQNIKSLDITLNNYAYFAPVSFLSLEVQDEKVKMAYMDITPQKPNGKTIVLLHGKNFTGNYWEQTAKSLNNEGYRVIIPDQVGFGKSSKPQHIQYSFQLLAANTKTLLDTLGITNAIIIGHSMGGMLATRFALMYPTFTQKLVLVCPIGLEDYKLTVPYQAIEQRYKVELEQNYAKLKNYQQENYYHGSWQPEYENLLAIQAGWTLNKKYPQIARNSALTYDMIYTQPVVYEFGGLKMPTLLITGTMDRTAIGKELASEADKKTLGNYPELGKRTAAKNVKIQLVELHTGHLPHIELFEEFIKPVTAFLQQ